MTDENLNIFQGRFTAIVPQSLLSTPLETKDRRRAEDDDDNDVISLTSQDDRRRPVVHRERSDWVRAVGRAPPRGRGETPAAVDGRRRRLGHAPEALLSAGGPSSTNDVTGRSARRRRQHVPTPIDRPPTTTATNRRRLPQPLYRSLGHLYERGSTPPSSAAFRPHHRRCLDQFTGSVRPPPPRRVLPSIPSERSRRRQLPPVRTQDAYFQPRPVTRVVLHRYESDNDSISV